MTAYSMILIVVKFSLKLFQKLDNLGKVKIKKSKKGIKIKNSSVGKIFNLGKIKKLKIVEKN